MALPTTSSPGALRASGSGGPGAIACAGLFRSFGDKVALHPFDLEVGPGGITGLLGPNGSGKSTLMRCLIGLVRPGGGTVRIDGVPLEADGAAIRRRVTYSPGELHLYGEMGGGELLDWLLRGRPREALARARARAREMELPLERKVRGFSHGMKRQLVFAAAMAPDVRVRILDEPTEGLDPTRRSQLLDALVADAARGTTILLSSHHLGEVDRVCERLVFLSAGRAIADETPASLRGRTARHLVLTWRDDAPLDGLEALLAGPEVESARRDGRRVVVTLARHDPRPFLEALARLRELPPPASIEHGRASLREVYRDLYGVEGT